MNTINLKTEASKAKINALEEAFKRNNAGSITANIRNAAKKLGISYSSMNNFYYSAKQKGVLFFTLTNNYGNSLPINSKNIPNKESKYTLLTSNLTSILNAMDFYALVELAVKTKKLSKESLIKLIVN